MACTLRQPALGFLTNFLTIVLQNYEQGSTVCVLGHQSLMALTMTENVQTSLAVNPFRIIHRTRPEYRNSFGIVARQDRFWTMWNVKDVVNDTWNVIRPKLEVYIDQNDSKIEYSENHAGARDLRATLRCYMVGRSKDRASPHVACISTCKWHAQAIKHLIVQSAHLSDVGWSGCLCLTGIRYPCRLGESAENVLIYPELSNFEVRLMDPSLYSGHYGLCGARAGIYSDGALLRTTTIGGIISLDPRPCLLTAGHALLAINSDLPNEDSRSLDELTWSLDENDLDPCLLDYGDGIDVDDPDSPHLGSEESDDVDDPGLLLLWNPPPLSSATVSSKMISSHLQWRATGCDWAALQINFDNFGSSQEVNTVQEPGKEPRYVEHLTQDVPYEGAAAALLTLRGSLQGRALTSLTSLGLPAWTKSKTAWCVRMSGVQDGDCGAWAIDGESGELLGKRYLCRSGEPDPSDTTTSPTSGCDHRENTHRAFQGTQDRLGRHR